jgi:excisionase family DNA binding protein
VSIRKRRLSGRHIGRRSRKATVRPIQRTVPVQSGSSAQVSTWEQLPVSMTVSDAASLLRLSENSVYELLKRGELLPLAVRVGNSWRFSRDNMRSFLEGGSHDAS